MRYDEFKDSDSLGESIPSLEQKTHFYGAVTRKCSSTAELFTVGFFSQCISSGALAENTSLFHTQRKSTSGRKTQKFVSMFWWKEDLAGV